MSDQTPTAAERLRAFADLGPLGAAGADFVRADLRGADLSGLCLAFVSLVGARLDGATLRGAELRHVDLTGASLAGADLTGARFTLVHAITASFAWARAGELAIEHSVLNGADFGMADLRQAAFRASSLDHASFAAADLTRAALHDTTCGDADFRAALLDRTDTGGSTFPRADFAGARRFFLSREIVLELCRRATPDDPVAARIIGAVATLRWCYAEAKTELEQTPGALDRALGILAAYPESGAMEALRDGWRPPLRTAHGGVLAAPV